jgi:hypothetical protein
MKRTNLTTGQSRSETGKRKKEREKKTLFAATVRDYVKRENHFFLLSR